MTAIPASAAEALLNAITRFQQGVKPAPVAEVARGMMIQRKRDQMEQLRVELEALQKETPQFEGDYTMKGGK